MATLYPSYLAAGRSLRCTSFRTCTKSGHTSRHTPPRSLCHRRPTEILSLRPRTNKLIRIFSRFKNGGNLSRLSTRAQKSSAQMILSPQRRLPLEQRPQSWSNFQNFIDFPCKTVIIILFRPSRPRSLSSRRTSPQRCSTGGRTATCHPL